MKDRDFAAKGKPASRVSSRERSIRSHLLQVLFIGMLPLGIFAALLMLFLWQAQEAERAKNQIETARTLASALDNALESSVKRLEFLATLSARDQSEIDYMQRRARHALALSPDWNDVRLIGADGSRIFSASAAAGAGLQKVELQPAQQRALGQAQPAISDLFVASDVNRPTVEISVPLLVNGKASRFLVARLELSWFDALLGRQGLPAGGIAGIFDRSYYFVARSHAGAERRGTEPAHRLLTSMQKSPQGIGRFTSLDGNAVYTSWTRTSAGWFIALATPAAPIERALTRYLLFLGACSILVIGGGLVFATLLGNRITNSLSLVALRAGDLALGKPLPAVPLSPVVELNVVSRALDETGLRLERAQRERDRLLTQERDARTSAERANRAKDEFLAMLGHELRNPLGAISNAIGVIRDPRHTEAQFDSASLVISRQAAHLKQLIDDLLDVGRVMTGKIVLERHPIDLAECVREVLATLDAAHTTQHHEIAVEAIPVWVVADATRIEQIVSNLVTNAVTYTPRSGAIRITIKPAGEFAVFEISDTGVGIPREILPNLFELFFQGEQAIDRPNSGLGIGLTLVKKLVELHGGTVTAASAGRGQGSTFTVQLPAVPAPAQPAPWTAPGATGRSKTVLVIEDNPDSRVALRMALELDGHHVYEAGDGRQGLEQARAVQPGIAIVDIGLPGMDGHEVAHAMRAEYGSRVFLIALTGYGLPEDKARARNAGFDLHLTKPVDLAQLAAIIDTLPPSTH